jgi:hypothetical protein
MVKSMREIHGLKPLRKTNKRGIIRKYSVSSTLPGRKRGKTVGKKRLTIGQAKSLSAQVLSKSGKGTRVRINYTWPGKGHGPQLVKEFLVTRSGSELVYKKGSGSYLTGRLK